MRLFSTLILACCVLLLSAQQAIVLPQQKLTPWHITTAHYSGITPLGSQRYALVSDKSPADGFYLWHIEQDSLTGRVVRVSEEGFRSTPPTLKDRHGWTRRDLEGIAYQAQSQSLWLSGEGDQRIIEHRLDGTLTGRELFVPQQFAPDSCYGNCGFEALCFDSLHQRFYTTSETTLRHDGLPPGRTAPRAPNLLRLQSFTPNGAPAEQYAYLTDSARAASFGRAYISGVPALCALPDGSLLVMEREGHFTHRYIGSWVEVKIYHIAPKQHKPISPQASLSLLPRERFLPKTLVARWTTRLNLTARSLANYEAMCLGAPLADGRLTLLCLNDSQASMGRWLIRIRDYIRVLILPPLFSPQVALSTTP